MNYKLRQRKPLPFVPPVPVSLTRVPVKNFRFSRNEMDFYFWKRIFDFLPYPCSIYLVFKPPGIVVGGIDSKVPLFPIEILISWNNSRKFDEFKDVLLSYNFRKSLFSKVARLGNYSTMYWFQINGLTINESVLVSSAQRGDVQLFARILNDIRDIQDKEEILEDAFNEAAEYGHIDIFKFALSQSLQLLYVPDEMLKFLKKASHNGHLNILEWYYIETGHLHNFQLHFRALFRAAIMGNQMRVVVWLKSKLEEINGDAWGAFLRSYIHRHVSIAAFHGNYEMLVWLLEHGFQWDQNSTSQAATGGNIEVLKYLILLKCPWSEDVCINAAKKGHLELLKWAKESNCPWPASRMFPAAVLCNNFELYQWLFDQACPFEEEESFLLAVKLWHFEFLKFARSNGSDYWSDELNRLTQEQGASRGDLDIIQWARFETIQRQREREQLPAVQQEGFEDFADQGLITPYLIGVAAEKGHLHILEFLRLEMAASPDKYPLEMQTLCDQETVGVAALTGHIAILDWALAIGVNFNQPVVYQCFQKAIKGSQFKVLVWLKNHFTTILTWYTYPLVLAAEEGDIEVFKWLRNNGMKWDDMAIGVAEKNDNQDIIDWAIKNGCPKGSYEAEKRSPRQRKGRLELSSYTV